MMRPRLTTLVRLAALAALVLSAPAVRAATITNLQAVHRNGQTFVTWDNLPGTGWLYHVYASPSPIEEVAALDNATELAIVGDHSAVDQRISMLLGQTLTFRIDANQPPLSLSRGLFVATPVASQYSFYVVLAQQVGMREDRTLVPGQNLLPDPVIERVDRPRPVWQRRLTSPAGEDYVLWTSNSSTPLFPAMGNAPGRAFHVGIIPGQKGGALLLHGHGRGGNFFNSFIGTGTPG